MQRNQVGLVENIYYAKDSIFQMERVAINPKFLIIQFQILGIYITGCVIAIFAKLYLNKMLNKFEKVERQTIYEKSKKNKILASNDVELNRKKDYI